MSLQAMKDLAGEMKLVQISLAQEIEDLAGFT